MNEPTTERGRYLLRRVYGGRMRPKEDFERLREDVLAIEGEAAAAERERIRKGVIGLGQFGAGSEVDQSDVLDVIGASRLGRGGGNG